MQILGNSGLFYVILGNTLHWLWIYLYIYWLSVVILDIYYGCVLLGQSGLGLVKPVHSNSYDVQ